MDSVVTEARVSLDARLFGQNVIVLALQIADNLLEGIARIDSIAESRGVNDSQRYADTILF